MHFFGSEIQQNSGCYWPLYVLRVVPFQGLDAVSGLVMLVRWIRGQPLFTERDWPFLFCHSRKEVFSLRLVLRFGGLWLLVVVVGLAIAFYILPYRLGWFVVCLRF
ncbi:MAG: hypothetical protein DMG16_01125 [Acidobacteria bacterium]|nr:MAG: hypothetical protein DMG16_01125 [Acidobacteriota bacterium]